MKAFKAFNPDMTCTSGHGKYQYAENMIFQESKAQAHECGFHCAEYILDCFKYYPEDKKTVVCPVEALGDISEDGSDTKIACTILKIGQRLNPELIVLEAIKYLLRHPSFKDAKNVHSERGKESGMYCIVRGKSPTAAGEIGTVLGLIQEHPKKKEVEKVGIYLVNGVDIKPGVYYDVDGKEVKGEKGRIKKNAKDKLNK